MLHCNEQYLKALLDASIVSKSDVSGKITYANENFCKITGYSEEEMLGKSHNIFRHPDNPDSIYKDMWQTIQAGKVWRGKILNLNKDGSTFIADTTIIPFFDNDGINGKIVEYLAIRNDITNEVALAQEIQKKEQEKIRDEQVKEAEKAFLVIFTHELKTPLNAIINFSKYIKKRIVEADIPQSNKLVDLSEAVLQNASDMLDNISQILEISKLNAGKLEYQKKLFSANLVIQNIEKKYHSLLEEKGVHLTYEMPEEVFVYSDEYRLRQIISNVFSNAIKYGRDKIKITVENNSDESKIIIEDNGIGIKHKEEVFELFAQEDESALERKGKGTGIGLYFVQLLCNDLDIKYSIEDAHPEEKYKGVKFILTFSNRRKNREKK